MIQTTFDSCFYVYDQHFDSFTKYLNGVSPILKRNHDVMPVLVEGGIVLMFAWHEAFLKSLVATAARSRETEARAYFTTNGNKDAATCDLRNLLSLAKGQIKFKKRGKTIENLFLALLGFAPWPSERSRNVFVDFNVVRQMIVHNSGGVVGDAYYAQLTDQTLFARTEYPGLPFIWRLDHVRVLIHLKTVSEAMREQVHYLRAEASRRPEWT